VRAAVAVRQKNEAQLKIIVRSDGPLRIEGECELVDVEAGPTVWPDAPHLLSAAAAIPRISPFLRWRAQGRRFSRQAGSARSSSSRAAEVEKLKILGLPEIHPSLFAEKAPLATISLPLGGEESVIVSVK